MSQKGQWGALLWAGEATWLLRITRCPLRGPITKVSFSSRCTSRIPPSSARPQGQDIASTAVDGGPGVPCRKEAASTQLHISCGAGDKDAGLVQPESPILQEEWEIWFHVAHRAIQLKTCVSSGV